MKKYFKLITKHKQKVYFSIEPNPAYTSEPGNMAERWELWRSSNYHWDRLGQFHTLKDAHSKAEQVIQDQNIEEYEIETWGMGWA